MQWYLEPGASLTTVRHEVRAYLERHALDHEGVEQADVVVAELLSNAVRHAGTGAWIEVVWDEEQPLVTVRDVGPGFTFAGSEPPPPLAESGRGLWMVARLSEQLQVSVRRHAGAAVTARLPVRRKPERSVTSSPVRFGTGPRVDLDRGPDAARDTFLVALVVRLAQALELELGAASSEDVVTSIGLAVSEQMEADYRAAHGVDGPLTPEQVADALVWLKRAIDGDFYVVDVDEHRAVLGNRRCPFGDAVRAAPALCRMTSSVFGGIAARNRGPSAVVLEERIAVGDPECRVTVWFTEPPQESRPFAHRYRAPAEPANW